MSLTIYSIILIKSKRLNLILKLIILVHVFQVLFSSSYVRFCLFHIDFDYYVYCGKICVYIYISIWLYMFFNATQ